MQHDENAPLSSVEPEATDNDESAAVLSEIDARVLGCLMEKQQTTPDQYPLTQNSLVLACNQKSSREPRMSLTGGEVGHCLRDLETRDLIKVDMGARTYQYEHCMTRAFNIDKTLQAVLAVMLLRGPQTINELFTRTQRTELFSSIGDIENALERLIERAEPHVKLIPRQAGQREDRYAHLLCGEPKVDATAAYAASARSTAQSSVASESTTALEARVEHLESQVLELQSAIEALKSS